MHSIKLRKIKLYSIELNWFTCEKNLRKVLKKLQPKLKEAKQNKVNKQNIIIKNKFKKW